MMDDDDWKPRDESLMDLVEEVLTEDEQEVMSMVVLGQMSYRKVAQVTGFSVGKCHALKHSAIEKLRKALTDAGVRNGSDEG